MTDNNNLVVEERQESSLVSPTNQSRSFRRKSHFLTPSAPTINTAVSPLPPPPPGFSLEYDDLPLQVNFQCWRRTTKPWEKWVEQMRALHYLTWEKAGIFKAIMSSKSINIHRNDVLIYGFVEKWSAFTNSFVFQWGEATVTLEDMLVIGGYSVLGDPVLISPNHDELVKKLVAECNEMKRSKAKKVDLSYWMRKFMDKGSEIEHEAFLAYWLSRFVFPMNVIGESVLPIAVRLSRGVRIALAPAVLAEIYQGLSLLKAALTAARKIGNGDGECDSVLNISVSAPLVLVQVWIWERFPSLRPKPHSIGENEPRIARWRDLRKSDIKDLSLSIDCGVEDFEWRPYMNGHADSSFHGKIYLENEYRVSVDDDLGEEFEGLIRCIRTSELVGLETGCIEQYLPHRVAMQFGLDQDLPGHAARENASPEIAWSSYTRPIRDKTLYVPPRFIEPGVTTRYLKWWKEINCLSMDVTSRSKHSKVEVTEDSKGKGTEEMDSVPYSLNGPEADLQCEGSFKSSETIFIASDSSGGDSGIPKLMKDGKNSINAMPRQDSKQTSPYKCSKTIFGEGSSSLKSVAQQSTYGESQDDDVQRQTSSSFIKDNGNFHELTSLPKPEESDAKNTVEKEQRVNGVESGDTGCEIGARLEERIVVLEKLCDLLGTGKLNHLLMKNPNK